MITGIDTVLGKKVFSKLSRSEGSNFVLAFPKASKVESCQDMELSLCKFVMTVVCRAFMLGLSRNCLLFFSQHKLFDYAVDGERKSGKSPDRVGANRVYGLKLGVRKPLWDQENEIKFDWCESAWRPVYCIVLHTTKEEEEKRL